MWWRVTPFTVGVDDLSTRALSALSTRAHVSSHQEEWRVWRFQPTSTVEDVTMQARDMWLAFAGIPALQGLSWYDCSSSSPVLLPRTCHNPQVQVQILTCVLFL